MLRVIRERKAREREKSNMTLKFLNEEGMIWPKNILEREIHDNFTAYKLINYPWLKEWRSGKTKTRERVTEEETD